MLYYNLTKEQKERFLFYSNFRLWILFLTAVCSPLSYFLCFIFYRKGTTSYNNCISEIKIVCYALRYRIFGR